MTASTLAVDIDMPHAFSNFGVQAEAEIGAADRHVLHLATRGCL